MRKEQRDHQERFCDFLSKNGLDFEILTKKKILKYIVDQFERGYDKGYYRGRKVAQ